MVNLLKKLMSENPAVKEWEYNRTLTRIGKPSYYSHSDFAKTRSLLFDLQTYPSWYFIMRILYEEYDVKVKDSALLLGVGYDSYYNWNKKIRKCDENNTSILLLLYKPVADLVYSNIVG